MFDYFCKGIKRNFHPHHPYNFPLERPYAQKLLKRDYTLPQSKKMPPCPRDRLDLKRKTVHVKVHVKVIE